MDANKHERGLRSYLIVFGAALLVSLVFLHFWQQEREAALAQLTVRGEAVSRELADDIASRMRPLAEKGRLLAESLERADVEGISADEIADLPRALFDDPDVRSAWFVFESGDEGATGAWYSRNKDDKDTIQHEVGGEIAESIMESDGYVYLRKLGGLRLVPGVRMEMGEFAPLWVGLSVNSIPTLTVDVPILRDGKFAGGAGFMTDIKEIDNSIDRATWSPRPRVFLVRPDGIIAMASMKAFSGGHYRDAYGGYADILEKCANATAGEGLPPFVGKTPSGETLVVSLPLEPGENRTPWFLASLYRMDEDAGMPWLLGIIIVWAAALLIAIVIYAVRHAKQAESAAAGVMPPMSPETAEAFRRLERRRGMCYVFSALFFIPAVFFIRGADKRYQEAKLTGNIEAAEAAVAVMIPIVAVCSLIGCFVVYLSLSYS